MNNTPAEAATDRVVTTLGETLINLSIEERVEVLESLINHCQTLLENIDE